MMRALGKYFADVFGALIHGVVNCQERSRFDIEITAFSKTFTKINSNYVYILRI